VWSIGNNIPITSITDGTSNTILFGETFNFDPNWPKYQTILFNNGLPPNFPFSTFGSVWTEGLYFAPAGSGFFPLNKLLSSSPLADFGDVLLAIKARMSSYGSGHPQGANFVFCDGSVHFISNGINNTTTLTSSYGSVTLLGSLCTRDGGEVINAAQY
jgi:prepilin-type processing-associated H-X9-DG protein